MRSAHYFNDSVAYSMYWFVDENTNFFVCFTCFTSKKVFHMLSVTGS